MWPSGYQVVPIRKLLWLLSNIPPRKSPSLTNVDRSFNQRAHRKLSRNCFHSPPALTLPPPQAKEGKAHGHISIDQSFASGYQYYFQEAKKDTRLWKRNYDHKFYEYLETVMPERWLYLYKCSRGYRIRWRSGKKSASKECLFQSVLKGQEGKRE